MRRVSRGLLTALCGLAGQACFFAPTLSDETSAAATTSSPSAPEPASTATSAAPPTTGDTTACTLACAGTTTSTSTSTTDDFTTNSVAAAAATTDASESTGDGGFPGFTPLQPLPISGAFELATAQLDDDDRDDLAVSSMTTPLLALLLGGQLTDPIVLAAGISYPLLAVDADADTRHDDLLLGYYAMPASLRLFRGDSGPTFDEEAVDLPPPCNRPLVVDGADLTDDGVLDYVVTCAENLDGAYLVLGDPDKGLSPNVVAFSLGLRPTAIHLLDVVDDASPDLIASHFESSRLLVYTGKGGGSFEAFDPLIYDVPNAAATAVGQLDADMLPDVVVSGLETDQCWVLRQLPQGGLDLPQGFACGPQVRDLALADFDGDTFDDLASIHLDLQLRVALNLGDATFAPPLLHDIGPDAWRVTTGDFDGDQRLDVAATSQDALSIYLNATP